LTEELVKTLTTNLLPFGGVQLRKTLSGIKATLEGGMFNSRGQLQYPIAQDLLGKLQAVIFGPYSGRFAQMYFDNEMSPLSDRDSAYLLQQVEEGQDPVTMWANMYKDRLLMGYEDKIRNILSNPALEQGAIEGEIKSMTEQFQSLMGQLTSIDNQEKLNSQLDTSLAQIDDNGAVIGTPLLPDNGSVRDALASDTGSIKTGIENVLAGSAKLSGSSGSKAKGKAVPNLGGIKLEVASINKPRPSQQMPQFNTISRPNIRLNYQVPQSSGVRGVRLGR
jgi:hypothetical protein